jgi:hypothetical protein
LTIGLVVGVSVLWLLAIPASGSPAQGRIVGPSTTDVSQAHQLLIDRVVVQHVVERFVTLLDDLRPDDQEFHAHAHHAEQQWTQSRGTVCLAPLRVVFCSWQTSPSGIGLALGSGGEVPGEWSTPFGVAGQHPPGLTPGLTYWLTCWTAGGTSYGPATNWQNTNLWYRLTNGLYVNDAWVYTGTNSPIPGVRHC